MGESSYIRTSQLLFNKLIDPVILIIYIQNGLYKLQFSSYIRSGKLTGTWCHDFSENQPSVIYIIYIYMYNIVIPPKKIDRYITNIIIPLNSEDWLFYPFGGYYIYPFNNSIQHVCDFRGPLRPQRIVMRSDPPCWELVGAEFIEDLWWLHPPKVCFCICQWELQDPKMEVR